MPNHCSARSEFISLRGLRYHVRHWGNPHEPCLFMLHGWMDTSATFQFVVEALAQGWHVIAPDWRGYGQSEWLHRPYWFPDYYADLDALLAHYSPAQPVHLVGHSMGANIAATYAAVRPGRVSRLVMLDFLGLLTTQADQAPQQLGHWLDNLNAPHKLASYESFNGLARRLRQSNPRLSDDRADFLANHVGYRRPDGRIAMACDPWHRIASPMRYVIEDVMATWRAIDCPVQLLIAESGFVHDRFGHDPEEFEQRIACFKERTILTITEAGHNLQHDQPTAVAQAVEAFLLRQYC
jgi:pimeloyl-ACP methyl ester carboxylesterase